MNIEGFLLSSGFALLVVLLGWATQITSKSKETKELEGEFLEKAKLKKSDYKRIINEKGSTEDSFSALVNFLYSSKREDEDVAIFEKIGNVKSDLSVLDNMYGWRFWILLFMGVSSFLSGMAAFFLTPAYKPWLLCPTLIFVIIIFRNLVKIHILEERYTKNISDVMEEL